MVKSELTTRQYGKLFKELVGVIKAPVGDFEGTIEISRLRKLPDHNQHGVPHYYDGEVDIIYRGKIMANNGQFYHPSSFGSKRIRNYFRSNIQGLVNMYVRPFGINNAKICKIKFEK